MGKFNNSVQLAKECLGVMRSDKQLSVFPVVSFLGVLLVTAAFAVPMYLGGLLDRLQAPSGPVATDYVVLFFYYLVMYFVIIFCSSALIGAAMVRLRGGDPTLGDGFRAAGGHLGSILGYSAISATVGLVMGLISSKGGAAGRVGTAVIQTGWNILTFLAVPILVMEGVGPVEAIKRSGKLLKKTWGEQLIGSGGIGLIFGLIILVIILLGIAFGVLAAQVESLAVLLTVLGIVLLLLAIAGLMSATLTGIYRAALYSFATTGEVGPFFNADVIKTAFSAKPEKSTMIGRV
jgi:hypothetical protein